MQVDLFGKEMISIFFWKHLFFIAQYYFLLYCKEKFIVNLTLPNMKKFVVILLIALSAMAKVFATETEQKVLLAPGKSFMYVIGEHKIDVFNVKKSARRFIDDSIANILYQYETVELSNDSILSRWTHLFGFEVVLKRQLVIKGNNVYLYYHYPEGGYPEAISSGVTKLFFIFSLLLLVVSLAMILGGTSVLIIKKILLFFLLIVFPIILLLGFIRSEYFTYFDCIILIIVLILPSFICSFIRIEGIRMMSRTFSLFIFRKIKLMSG